MKLNNLLYFSYQLLNQVTVSQDGMTIKPRKKFIPWNDIKEITISKISEKYDEMPLFANCLTLITYSGQRIALSNRFDNLLTLVNLITEQIEQPVINNMISLIEQDGYFKFSDYLRISANELIVSSTSKQFNIDFKRISNVVIDKEELKIFNLEYKLIYRENIQSVKNSIFMETLIQKLKH